MALWSLLSSSFVGWSARQLDSNDDSDTLPSFSPSFSSLSALELCSVSMAHCCFPAGGDVVEGEGTGLEWERLGTVLVLMVW